MDIFVYQFLYLFYLLPSKNILLILYVEKFLRFNSTKQVILHNNISQISSNALTLNFSSFFVDYHIFMIVIITDKIQNIIYIYIYHQNISCKYIIYTLSKFDMYFFFLFYNKVSFNFIMKSKLMLKY